MEGLRTLATVFYGPVDCYFTLPNETHDLNVVSGSVQINFLPAVLSTSESEASLPLCHSRTAAVRILPH